MAEGIKETKVEISKNGSPTKLNPSMKSMALLAMRVQRYRATNRPRGKERREIEQRQINSRQVYCRRKGVIKKKKTVGYSRDRESVEDYTKVQTDFDMVKKGLGLGPLELR